MPYKTLGIIGATIASIVFCLLCGYKAGINVTERKYLQQIANNNIKIQQLEGTNNILNKKVSENLNAERVKTDIQYKTIYKERVQYVESNPDIIVNVPAYWGMYINAAINNTNMSNADSSDRTITATSPVGIDKIADGCVDITNAYYQCKSKYEAWQKWYNGQVEIRSK